MKRRTREKPEPTTALINIVFLMLIFFLVAGTLAQPLDKALTLVKTSELDQAAPPDALVIHADGRLQYRGEEIADSAAFAQAQFSDEQPPVVRLVPDRDLPASELVEIGANLRALGAKSIVIVTERGLE